MLPQWMQVPRTKHWQHRVQYGAENNHHIVMLPLKWWRSRAGQIPQRGSGQPLIMAGRCQSLVGGAALLVVFLES